MPQPIVRREREELDELVRERDLGEDLLRLLGRLDALDLLQHALARDLPVAHPLPELRARDLGRGHVLHQVVDRRRADAAQPRVEVADPDADVRGNALVGDLAGRVRNGQEVGGGDVHVVAHTLDLVRPLAEHGVELVRRDRDEIGMRDPRAVEAVPGLALLVLAHLRERDLVHLGILAGGDERGHPAHRVRAAPVARRHEQLRVGAHERHGHRHLRAVGQHELRPRAELLDHAEDVVPAAGVQPRRVLAELVEDRVHLERREDRLDQDGGADRARGRCRARPARGGTRRSRAAPRGGSRASAGRSTAPSRARGAPPRCGRRRGRSRRGSPRPARRRRARAARRGASRAGGGRGRRSPRSAGRSSRRCPARSCRARHRRGCAGPRRCSATSASTRPRSRP